MEITFAVLIAAALLFGTVAIHYEVLRATSALIPKITVRPRNRMLVVIAGIIAAHLTEISLYALVYHFMHTDPSLGRIDGEFSGNALDFFYFSITCYTTLGVGDLFPHGPLRVVAGIEALNGF